MLSSQWRPYFHALLRGTRRRKHRLLERHLGYSTFAQATGLYSESLEDRTLLAAPHPLDLSSLNGVSGFAIYGIDVDDRSGVAVTHAGDVNGDGFDDLIIGASDADPHGNDRAGESYVVFGQSGGFAASIDLHTLTGSNGFVINGIDSEDRSGYSVSGAGDVNGDGFDDLIIGARDADPHGIDRAGESYVIFGQSGGFAASIDLHTLTGSNGFVINGIDVIDSSGRSVSSAGDVNGDGFDDLIIGASGGDPNGTSAAGESYVVFGQPSRFSPAIDLSSLDGTNGFAINGIDSGDFSGTSVSGAGDVNGDGFGDLIIGASGGDPNGKSFAGESYVVFGQPSGFSPAIDLRRLDGTNGFAINGIDAGDNSGFSVSGAGDVNGDGFDDLIIGTRAGPAGESYVVFGQPSEFSPAIDLSSLDGTNGFAINGIDAGDNSGRSVSGAGDVNGDGFDDLIIGAHGGDPSGNSGAGESYVVFGQPSGFSPAIDLSSLDGTNGFAINGIDSFDYSGRSVSGAGDVNGDGFDDLIIGALIADPHGSNRAGESYVVFGGNFTGGSETQVGDAAPNLLTASQGSDAVDILIGAQGDDTLIGDGGDDVLLGGHGNDLLMINDVNFSGTRRLNGGAGIDTLTLNGAGLTLDLRAISDNRIIDIEQIDITGTGDNVLTIDFQEVLNLSSHSNTLIVSGDQSDTAFIGSGWIRQPDEVIGAATYQVFTQGACTLKIAPRVRFTSIELAGLLGINGFVINGIDAVDLSGSSVSGAGDVNGDGFDDLIIGAYRGDPNGKSLAGESYVVFGQPSGFSPAIDLSSLDGTNGFAINGIDFGDYSGRSVSSAGDVNGDGFDDLIIGASRGDPNGTTAAGESYVVFGQPSGFSPAIDLSSLDGTNGFAINGIDSFDLSGRSVSSAGDVNGDGFDDLVIGAPSNLSFIKGPGESYVVFGQPGGFSPAIDLSSLDGTNGFAINGIDAGDNSGFSVSGAGDVNGDGFDDLIIGTRAGESYVVFGQPSEFSPAIDLSSLDGTNGFAINGIDAGDLSGYSVSGAGDVNGDGFGDLIIGARSADPHGNGGAGESYVVFGGNFITGNFTGGSETQVGDSAANTLTASQGSDAVDILIGAQGDDTLISDGGDDVLLGGHGNDFLMINDVNFSGTRRLNGGAGIDTLTLNGAGLTLDLRAISDNRIIDIEQIDITGSGINTLALNLREVLNISGNSNTLIVRRNAGDTVDIGPGWTQQSDAFLGPDVFDVLTQGSATLMVQTSLPSIISNLTGLQTYKENRPPLILSPNGRVTDPDSTTFETGTLRVRVLNPEVGDQLAVVDFRSVSVSAPDVHNNGNIIGTVAGNNSDSVLITLNSAATLEDIEDILNAVAYSNSRDNPVGGTRDIEFTTSDGAGGISAPVVQQIDVQPQSDRPVINNLGGPVTFIEGAGPIGLTSTGTVTDPDQHPDWATARLNVRVSRNADSFDRLTIENQGNGAGQIGVAGNQVFFEGTQIGTFNGGVGTTRLQINFIAGSTEASIQALVRAIQFENLRTSFKTSIS